MHQGSDVNTYSETGSACKAENSKQMNDKQPQLAFQSEINKRIGSATNRAHQNTKSLKLTKTEKNTQLNSNNIEYEESKEMIPGPN